VVGAGIVVRGRGQHLNFDHFYRNIEHSVDKMAAVMRKTCQLEGKIEQDQSTTQSF
jgi:hypothetical protein